MIQNIIIGLYSVFILLNIVYLATPLDSISYETQKSIQLWNVILLGSAIVLQLIHVDMRSERED